MQWHIIACNELEPQAPWTLRWDQGLDKAAAINCHTESNLNTCYCHCYIVTPVVVAAEMEAGKGSSLLESQWSLGAELACGSLRDR